MRSEELRLDFGEGGELRHASAQGAVHFAATQERAWELNSQSAEAIFAAGSVLRQFIARGEVEVLDQSRALYGQRVQLFLEAVPDQDQPVMSRAVAEQDVWVWYQERKERLEAGGDRLEWDRDSDTYVLTGDPNAYIKRGETQSENWKIILQAESGKMTLPAGEKPVTTRQG